jgi:hypothetical protein
MILVTGSTGNNGTHIVRRLGVSKRGTGQISGVAFADSLFVMFVNETALVPTARPSMLHFQCVQKVWFGLNALSDHQTLEIWNPRTFSIFDIVALSSLSELFFLFRSLSCLGNVISRFR